MSRYHTITDVYTTVLLLTKPSSDDDSVFRHVQTLSDCCRSMGVPDPH